MTQKRSYKQYREEFKEEAETSIIEQSCTVLKASKSLGVATKILYRLKGNCQNQKTGKALSEDERTELKNLRREVKTIRV